VSPLKAVADANAVIGLVKGAVFAQLPQLFTIVWVPQKVTEEVVVRGRGKPGASELSQALGKWVLEVAPDPAALSQFAAGLSIADREVLAVARAESADFILTDDQDLRREASRFQLACLAVPEVLLLLKDRTVITSVRSVLDRMLAAQHGIDPDVYERTLRAANEWPVP
jgi:predicted nucleic acid-binding protein